MAKEYTANTQATGDKTGSALCSREDAWWHNLETGDATTAVEIVAAPSDTTQSLFVTDLIVSCESAMAFEIRDDDATGSPAETGIGLPKQYASANSINNYHLSQPYKVGENRGLTIRTYSAGNVTVWIGGYTI